jgi:hypothetical protein
MKKNQIFTDNIKALAGPEKWGWVRRLAKKVDIDDKRARNILVLGHVPKSDTLQKIAKAYNTTVDALLTDPAEIKKTKKALPSYLDIDPELQENLKDPEFKKFYDKAINLIMKTNKTGDEFATDEMLDALKDVYQRVKRRQKKNPGKAK